MATSVAEILRVVRRKRGSGLSESATVAGHSVHNVGNIRMSGTSTQTLTDVNNEQPLGGYIGREGNDWPTPDDPRGTFVINQANGDRLQDVANTHLSEGPTPGRIPRPWNARKGAKVGRGITGQPVGDDFLTLGVSGSPDNGVGDAKYIEHVQIPRGSVIARAYQRTVDDSANIPGVYVSDPTRR
jgi:hypothetical protein